MFILIFLPWALSSTGRQKFLIAVLCDEWLPVKCLELSMQRVVHKPQELVYIFHRIPVLCQVPDTQKITAINTKNMVDMVCLSNQYMQNCSLNANKQNYLRQIEIKCLNRKPHIKKNRIK